MLRNKNILSIVHSAFIALALAFSVPNPALALDPAAGGIENPLGKDATIQTVLTGIITWILGIAAMLALLALVWGGILIILGFLNEEYVKEGKNIIKWAIIGLIVIGASVAILGAAIQIVGLRF